MDYQLELFLEHPWVWFSHLQTTAKFIVGAAVFYVLMFVGFFSFLIDSDLYHPEESKYFLYRLAVGLLLQLGLIIYFWPEIYHFFRWWFPSKNLFVQLGSLALICLCLILFGYNIECGLLRGGIGKPIYSCIWGGLQRERGFIWFTASLLFMLSFLYSIIYIVVWIISGLLDLVQKLL